MRLPGSVTICEVGTRDGFQIEPDFIPTELKIEVVDRLSDAGVPRIEVTSFVHPKVVPQLRDAEAVMAKIRRRPGVRYAALVPNDKGAVSCGVSTSFGCPFEGDVPLDQLESVVGRLVDMGARAIGLADTTGMANPRQVGRAFEHLMPKFPGIEWTLHTHDTRAMAIPNILAGMECGVTHIDASIGGLGGCPFVSGASSNIYNKNLIHYLTTI